MAIWFLIIVTASIAALLNALLSISKPKPNLPPGPRPIPILSTVLWLGKSSTEIRHFLKTLGSKFGPIVTLHIGSRPVIFVSNRDLAHQALIQQGAVFADRPESPATSKIMSSNQHNISSAGYGPRWRMLRRNLTSNILHPLKAKGFSSARKWALDTLISHLKQESDSVNGSVKVVDHFRFSMFCLLVFMCFGDKIEENRVREVEEVVHKPLVSFSRYQILNFLPWLTRILLKSRWNEFLDSRKKQEEVLIPYIRNRKQLQDSEKKITCYLDTLFDIELSEDGKTKRKLNEQEIVTACSEFLTAGTDTTSTALQWIMANLVKYPNIQTKLYEEIKQVVQESEKIDEEDLSKMPYLKSVILEGLRRHPPGHFVLPHAVTEETKLGGYTVPKNAVIHFIVAEIGWDPKVWDEPMEFRPERFMTGFEEEFDITGNREIKMMPFGAGRRMCPAAGLAMLHLEYFVANLVWKFEWKVEDGKEVDLSEKQEFTIVMKNPLHARIFPR